MNEIYTAKENMKKINENKIRLINFKISKKSNILNNKKLKNIRSEKCSNKYFNITFCMIIFLFLYEELFK